MTYEVNALRKNDIKKHGKVMLSGLLLAAILTITGCGSAKPSKDTTKQREELLTTEGSFTYETNNMDQWVKNLDYTKEGVITKEGIRGVKVALGGNDVLQISYEPRDYKNTYDCWAFSKPYDSLAYVDTEAMYEYFSLIENMPLQVVDTEDLSVFGEAAGDIYVAYNSMQTKESKSPYPDQGVDFVFGDVTEDGYQYVMIDGMDTLFVTGKEYADALLTIDPFHFVLQVVNVVMMDTVSELEIATKTDYLSMKYDGNEYQMNGKKTSFEAYNAFYTQLMTVFIANAYGEVDGEGVSGESAASGTECILALFYHRNVENAPDICVKYFTYDDQYVVASINGKRLFMVEKSEVDTLIKTISEM